MGSYSDEQGFCSYFSKCWEVVQLLPWWTTFIPMDNLPIMDWPSYVELTFLVFDDSMDELEMVWFLLHHQEVFWSIFGFWGYFGYFRFRGYFGHFSSFEGYFGHFKVLGIFWSIFRFWGYFGNFFGLRGIFIIFRFWGYFDHIFRFQEHFF